MIGVGAFICVLGIMIIMRKYTLKLHKELEEEEEELVKIVSRKTSRADDFSRKTSLADNLSRKASRFDENFQGI